MCDPVLGAPGVTLDAGALLGLRAHVRHAATAQQRLVPGGPPGGFATRRRGRGLEAIDVRVFSDGDDIRHLDRNTTARSGIPHVRTFRDERERTALLIADFRPAMLWGTRRAFRSVAAAEALTALGWGLVEAGGRVGAIAVSAAGPPVFVPARGRERGMVSVIGGLVAAHQAALAAAAEGRAALEPDEPSLARVLEAAAKLLVNGGSVVLASALDEPGETFDQVAGALGRQGRLSVLLIQDAFELRPPAGCYRYATGRSADVHTFRAARRAPHMPDARMGRLRRLGVAVVPVDAGWDGPALVRQVGGAFHGRR